MTVLNIERFKDLRAASIPDYDSICRSVLGEFEGKTQAQKRERFAQSRKAGGVFIITSDRFPEAKGLVLEAIPGIKSDDFMLCLYAPHPIFNAVGDVVRAREDLISMIEDAHGAAPGHVVIPDAARGRNLLLQELGTMQLVDQVTVLMNAKIRDLHS